MRIDWKCVFALAVLVLATGAPAQELPKADSWRHQRPAGAEQKDTQPKVVQPKATTPARERKVVAPKPEPQFAAPKPEPQFAAPPGPNVFEEPPRAALAAELLLSDALEALAPQRPGVHDLYFLAFAGWGDQAVFRKEAERVRTLFDQRFGTKDRSLILVNSPDTGARYPAATVANLRLAVTMLSRKMDLKEDVLVLFLTSHGEPNRGIVNRLNGHDLDLLTPRLLAQALDQTGIKNRVVVISACYAGQFMTALESDDSLVITAAAASRMSFGCTTSAEWTWFGQSYFVDALPKVGKLVPAFARAKELVAQKETAEKVTPSQPQISVGKNIEKLLTALGY